MWYNDCNNNLRREGIGDYLLFAVAYRWISKIVYCGKPYGDCNDYHVKTLKNFEENDIMGRPTENTIQLLYNPHMSLCDVNDICAQSAYIERSIKEPEVPLLIIPTIEDVAFCGNYDFISMAQSPNYTPESADFIMDIFQEYMIEE